MSETGRYILQVSMDVHADKEDLFNEVYDQEHIPFILAVPGVISARRYVREPLRMSIGGEVVEMDSEGQANYTAIYELESPEVLLGEAWAEAVERGRWGTEVRPHTFNRSHVLRKQHG